MPKMSKPMLREVDEQLAEAADYINASRDATTDPAKSLALGSALILVQACRIGVRKITDEAEVRKHLQMLKDNLAEIESILDRHLSGASDNIERALKMTLH